MEIVPVLDVAGGEVVHGRQTDRGSYPPVHEVSEVVETSDPVAVAEAFPSRRVYVADLDSIEGTGDNRGAVEALSRRRDVLLDPGIETPRDLEAARRAARHPVLGTETCPFDVMELAEGRAFVSLDVEDGVPLEPERLAKLDLAGVILLLLSRVGTRSGVDRGLVRDVVERCGHPVLVGGGVSSRRDLEVLEDAGAAGALVSTALHDGSLSLG